MSDTTTTTATEEDYLNEDKPLKHTVKKQNWCVVSMLTPMCFPESKREQFKDQPVLGIKFRGTYEEYNEATARAQYLQKVDKFHNVFVGEVGKWLPFDVDVSNMGDEDKVYRESSLNKYMKSYKEALGEEDKDEKTRKDTLLKNANIVTGKHDAPESTGLGVFNENETVVEVKEETETETETGLDSPKEVKETLEKCDEELLKTVSAEGDQLKQTFTETQKSVEALEDKMRSIQELYSKLNQN